LFPLFATGLPPSLANISGNKKKNEMTLMFFSGAWGKMIHEKNRKQKILGHRPFNHFHIDCFAIMATKQTKM
jgi:hypothetical protein